MGSGGVRVGGSPRCFVLARVRRRGGNGGSFEWHAPPNRQRRAQPPVRPYTTGARRRTRRALPDGSDSASLAAAGLEPGAHASQRLIAVDEFGLAFADLTDAAVDLGRPRLL